MRKKVFLSSTAKDLAEYREAVANTVERMDGYECVRMETFGARDSIPDKYCREQVRNCDVFVCILSFLYGSCPPGSEKSFTEREYEMAVETGKPLLIFLADKEIKLSASLREGVV